MEVRTWVMATILFSLGFAMFVVMLNDGSRNYVEENVINPSIEERYNKLSESSDLVGDLSASIKEKEGLSLIGGIRTLFTATIGVVNAVFNSLAIIPVITFSIGDDFGIPSEVTSIFFIAGTLLITIAIIFAILNSGSGGRV